MGWFRPLSLFVLVLSLLALGACGGASPSLTDNAQQGPTLSGGAIPSIWELDNVDRSASGVVGGGDPNMTRLGREYLENLVHNGTDDGDSVVLDSGAGGEEPTAWAVYRFTGLSGMRPQTLNTLGTLGGLEQQYYIGIANYTTGSWEWFGPSHLPEFQVDLRASYSRYVTALGNMYFLVICEGGDVFTHEQTVMTFGNGDGGVMPGAPRDLVASDGEFADKVHISWLAGEGATSYEVYRRADGHNMFEKIGETEDLVSEDTTADEGVVYIYKARSKNEHGVSGHSNGDSGYRGDLPQGGDCPTELSASDGTYDWKVYVTWNGSPSTEYKLWRKQDGMGSFAVLAEVNGTSYADESATPGVHYIYKVSTLREGESCYSNTDSGYRSAGNQQEDCPGELSASDGLYAEKVKLHWAGNAGLGYDIYRRVDGENEFQHIGFVTGLSYYDMTAEPGVTYIYKIGLEMPAGDCFSNTDAGWRAEANADCPTELGASDGTHEAGVHLEWQGNSEVAYDIYRKLANGQEWDMLVTTEAGLSYLDETAEVGVHYTYKVKKHGGDCHSNADEGFRGEAE
jgi:fibronectin type 3 domain-containing protein